MRVAHRYFPAGWLILGSLSIGLLSLLVVSCSTPPRVEDFENSIGHVSQDQLIHRFGYPQRLKLIRPDIEVWDYEFLSGRSRCLAYRVYFDENQRSQRWEPIACC